MPLGINHQCCSTVSHIEVDVEVLVDTLEHLHRLTGCKKSCRMGADGIGFQLMQLRLMAVLIVLQCHQIIVENIRCGQMHILAHRQVQFITGLVRIHEMLVMLQTG